MGQRHQRTRVKRRERAQRLQTGHARQHRAGRLLLTGGELDIGSVPRQTPGSGFQRAGSRDVLDFAGIDRTTVSRRKASCSALLQDAAVKILQIRDLLTQATEVFGAPKQASTWLTRPHPSLAGETPLKRARTPWGMSKVQSILVALRYGAAA